MVRLAVIADDLTGANDTGVQFAKQGLKTTVLFSGTKLKSSCLTDDIVVFNTDSRALENEKAYECVYELCKQLNEFGISKVMKKIDSTMRGNIGSEIDAVMDVFKYDIAFVVPAFPRSNRITKHGVHYVNGVPLADTEIANDPTCPVKESYLPALLQAQSKREIQLISIEDVNKGADTLSDTMKQLVSDKVSKIIVIDASTDDELKTIAEAAMSLEKNVLWVGSAGIAYHLSHTVKQTNSHHEIKAISRSPVLFVAGSISSITHEQIRVLKETSHINEIMISPHKFFYEDERQHEIDRVVEAGKEFIKKGDLVISTNREKFTMELIKSIQHSLKLSNCEIGEMIAQSMGIIASRIIESHSIHGAVLTGGDIAAATCKELNGKGIQVIGEVEDGIPYGRLIGGQYDGLSIITKAGALGTKQAFVKALHTLIKKTPVNY